MVLGGGHGGRRLVAGAGGHWAVEGDRSGWWGEARVAYRVGGCGGREERERVCSMKGRRIDESREEEESSISCMCVCMSEVDQSCGLSKRCFVRI